MKYISTGDQLANIFTKSLSTSRFHFLRSKIMVFIEPMVLRGDDRRRTYLNEANEKDEDNG